MKISSACPEESWWAAVCCPSQSTWRHLLLLRFCGSGIKLEQYLCLVGLRLFLRSYFLTSLVFWRDSIWKISSSSIYAVSQSLFRGALKCISTYRFFKIVFLRSVGSAVSGADSESLDLGSLQYSDPWINSCTLQQIIVIINTVLWNICAQRPLQKHI